MCFGNKNQYESEPAARPAQAAPPPQQQSSPGQGKQQQQQQSSSSADYQPPSGPPPNQLKQKPVYDDHSGVAPPPGPPPGKSDYASPPGPPPPRQAGGSSEYAPPSGPPPSQQAGSSSDYAPPPGPPPARYGGGDSDFAPPSGPPPSKGANDDYAAPPPGPPPSHQKGVEKPLHDWEAAVPDTSLFPPPPDIFSGWDRSPATNAPEAEANAGEDWVKQYPLSPPITLDAVAQDAIRAHNPRLLQPPAGRYAGTLAWTGPGVWAGKTEKRSRDSCILGYPPLYAVSSHSPLATHRPKTIYYEVHVGRDSPDRDICLALGYAALPYPTFRMPGWHRGSLAVHGDDGHRYVNDRWGGKDFVRAFRRGETYGIGITFSEKEGKIDVDIFFTREGRMDGKWNLHEETDAQQDLPVTGLEGFHDLSVAVGTFQNVSFEVIFDPAKWKYRGAEVL